MNEFEARDKLEAQRKEIKTFEDLMKFLEDVKTDYNSDYGTAPRAIAQACLAAGYYLADEFGITGFQAGFVMWEFIRGWLYEDNKCGIRMVDYDNMLYPQYEYKFRKTINSETWRSLQEEAKRRLEDSKHAHPYVISHWESIIRGEVPFGYTICDEL